jgi:hypothetical protein
MITLRLYETGDWLKIRNPVEPFTSFGEFDEIMRGIAVTATENDTVMACGGIVFCNDYEGNVWVKMSAECAKRPFMWTRTVKETFDIMVKSIGDLKISTYILDNFCKGERLAKLINLKRSGETEEYNGNTYNKYLMVA